MAKTYEKEIEDIIEVLRKAKGKEESKSIVIYESKEYKGKKYKEVCIYGNKSGLIDMAEWLLWVAIKDAPYSEHLIFTAPFEDGSEKMAIIKESDEVIRELSLKHMK